MKTFWLLPDQGWIWLDFPDFNNDHIKKVYQSDMCFGSHILQTGDFHRDCGIHNGQQPARYPEFWQHLIAIKSTDYVFVSVTVNVCECVANLIPSISYQKRTLTLRLFELGLDNILFSARDIVLTLKHRETHGCVVSTVATDALVLKHQAISILSTD